MATTNEQIEQKEQVEAGVSPVKDQELEDVAGGRGLSGKGHLPFTYSGEYPDSSI